MGFTSSHNSTIQSRDCSSELDFAILTIKPSLCGSRASVAQVLADTIGQHVEQVSVDISVDIRPTYVLGNMSINIGHHSTDRYVRRFLVNT